MEINRNQYFMIGVVLVLLGIQFRNIESFTLTEPAAKFVARQSKTSTSSTTTLVSFQTAAVPAYRRDFQPPKWIGWMLLSVGGVLILHSLAMPRPS